MGKKRKGETRGKDKKRRRRKKNLEKVWLNQSPVSPGMKLVSAELRNVRSGRFERRKVMVDSCSEVSMATRDFLEPICGSLPITVKGLNAVAPSRITGHAGIGQRRKARDGALRFEGLPARGGLPFAQ